MSRLPDRSRLWRGGVTVVAALAVMTFGGHGWVAAAPLPYQVVSGYGRTIRFSGCTWLAKTSNIPVGPGPNYFSDTPNTVWTDEQDRLHLRLARDDWGTWQAAEVVLQASVGYGTYQFALGSPAEVLDPRVVLGLFTWNDDPAENHRELDIELGRWSQPTAPNGRYSVQPYQLPDHIHSYDQPPGIAPSTQSIEWQPDLVSFSSWMGLRLTPPSTEALIGSHVFTDGIPRPGGEQVRINLWLDGGLPPTDLQPVEVIVEHFQFSGDSQAPGTPNPTPDSCVRRATT